MPCPCQAKEQKATEAAPNLCISLSVIASRVRILFLSRSYPLESQILEVTAP
jgi:hypothetical protein